MEADVAYERAIAHDLVKHGLIVALSLLKDRSFVDYATFGIALVVSHIGLLAWEAKSVRLSLAYPGLTPRAGALGGKD